MSFPILTPNSSKQTFTANLPLPPNALHLSIAGELEEIAKRIRSGELVITDFEFKSTNGGSQMIRVEVY